MADELLDTRSVVAHLRRRGLLSSEPVIARELGGGVSNVTLAVGGDTDGVVVKQALGTLRVAQPWHASRRRVVTEAEALRMLGRMTPDAVPRVIDVDDEALVLVIEQAPRTWRDWREELLEGTARLPVARRLGELLATWHERTSGLEAAGLVDDGSAAFEALRLGPFHRAVALALPDTSAAIAALLERMSAQRTALVHGDFSPKNVLVDPEGEGVWVIDLEVAHHGDPFFDVAFLLAHLQLKAIAAPSSASSYDALGAEFIEAYRAHKRVIAWDEPYVLGHLGALLLARVHGLSPAEYLDGPGRRAVTRLGRALLAGEVPTIGGVAGRREWERRE